jgi:hypothetical protein
VTELWRVEGKNGRSQELLLFICSESHEQFFSYLATVTIAGDWAANLTYA